MLSFKEVAEIILKDSSKPLSANEITELAFEQNLLETEGKTPEATMAAQIYSDIKNNSSTIFVKVGKGKFTLRNKIESVDSPELLIERQNEIVKKDLIEKLHEIDPYMFEFLIGDLLKQIGYENVEVTKRSGDGGVDVKANLTVGGLTNVKTVIQVKRYKPNVDVKVIRELRGSAEVDQRGLVITTSKFAKSAVDEAKAPNKMPVSLVDGDKLIELMFRYGVGVKKEEKIIYTLDSGYFENDIGGSVKSVKGDKNMSIWPLPGGGMNYINTLNNFLEVVRGGVNSKSELVQWYKTNYENVNSDKAASSYINVPKGMGLTTLNDGKYCLTDDGMKYIENKDIGLLYEIISKNIFGFDEMIKLLESSDEPQNEQDFLDYLKENHGIEWTTFAQINFRIMWLLNLQKIQEVEDGYILVK